MLLHSVLLLFTFTFVSCAIETIYGKEIIKLRLKDVVYVRFGFKNVFTAHIELLRDMLFGIIHMLLLCESLRT